jgi:hypothetical protein
MTRKLTDEQVKAIDRLVPQRGYTSFPIPEHPQIKENAIIVMLDEAHEGFAYKIEHPVFGNSKVFISYEESADYLDKVVAHIEHLLNQRYCWLPKNNGWIMSGEVITYKTAGKVLELLSMVNFTDRMFYEEQYGCKGDWYNTFGGTTGNDCMPLPSDFNEESHFTIDSDSPIWDAVKGVE